MPLLVSLCLCGEIGVSPKLDTTGKAINDPARPDTSGRAAKPLPKTSEHQPAVETPIGALLPAPVFDDRKHHIKIYQGDCLEILAAIPEGCVDLIFADPPYFLSNDGITCHAGRMVSVNKGDWDRSRGPRNRDIIS